MPTFDEAVAAARNRVDNMDSLDGHKDRNSTTILSALEAGLRQPHSGAHFDAYVMLKDVVEGDEPLGPLLVRRKLTDDQRALASAAYAKVKDKK